MSSPIVQTMTELDKPKPESRPAIITIVSPFVDDFGFEQSFFAFFEHRFGRFGVFVTKRFDAPNQRELIANFVGIRSAQTSERPERTLESRRAIKPDSVKTATLSV